MIKRYIYREQYSSRGHYAEMIFEVDFKEGQTNDVQITYLAEPTWELMCRAGITLFYNYYTRFRQGTLLVIVHEIKWLPVDTNHLIVLFSSVKGLCEVFNYQIESLRFDSNTETFNFPEFRNLGT